MTLNLSRRPFINHRLFWIAVATIAVVSIWLVLWVSSETSLVTAQADAVAQLISAKDGEVKAYQETQEKRRQEDSRIGLTDKDNQELAAARRLIAGRAFSWNGLIADIENYVPNKARITSVQVTEAFADTIGAVAVMEIKAVGETSAQLTEMMERLDKSDGLFQLRNFDQDAAAENGEIPFTIRVTYTPNRGGH
jgi:hypothetical protein